MSGPVRILKPKPRPAQPRRHPARETILLVDDEKIMCNYLAELLGNEGYRVLVAGDGEEALVKSEKYGAVIHLLITDVMMPVMNGKELADRLCALRPEIKVLFISGYRRTDVWPLDACEDQTDWLPKPFTAPMFHAKVRAILGSVAEP
ncbi:MAG: putative Histidine kinase [Fibrobacteres bacterium]|nr:putative Histidine kinase [Fibrobacterota bacterium]